MVSELAKRTKEYEAAGNTTVLLEYARMRRLNIVVCGKYPNVMELCREIENENLTVQYICTDQKYEGKNFKQVSFQEILEMDPDKIVLLFSEKPQGDFRMKYLKLLWGGVCTIVKNLGKTYRLERTLHKKKIKYDYVGNRFAAYNVWIDYYLKHEKEISAFRNLLEDDESKAVLDEVIRAIVQNDFYRYHELQNVYKYFADYDNRPIYKHLENEVWINCGSSNGDTIYRYISAQYRFKKIYAYEGNKRSYNKLRENIGLLKGSYGEGEIILSNQYVGLNEAADNLDNLFCNEKVTFINCDIEGAELGFLKGAKNIIKRDAPVLAICLYHKKEDIPTIPAFIYSCNKKYKFFLRKCVSYRMDLLQTNELILYAVPEERMIISGQD